MSGAAAGLRPAAWKQPIATDTASQQPVSSHLAGRQPATSPEPTRRQAVCQPGSRRGAARTTAGPQGDTEAVQSSEVVRNIPELLSE